VPARRFDVDAEVDFIDSLAAAGKLIAIGECGLDAYYTQDAAVLAEQERVLLRLMAVAQRHALPLILHSRKAELRVFEMLQLHGVLKADFHCYCGKLKLAQRIAEAGQHTTFVFNSVALYFLLHTMLQQHSDWLDAQAAG
jgi:TatD DNase family protein